MTSNINEKILPPSPNWYCSRNSDWNQSGIYAVGVKNEVMLFLPQELKILGFLIGHENRITSVAFFQVSVIKNKIFPFQKTIYFLLFFFFKK